MNNRRITYCLLASVMVLAGCAKEPLDSPTGQGTEITPSVVLPKDIHAEAQSVNPATQSIAPATKAPADGSAVLDLYFARADQDGSGTYQPYGTAIRGSRAAGAGAVMMSLVPKQYYLINGKATKMVGWYPGGGAAAGDHTGRGFYDATTKTVSWTIDGSHDVMTATAQEGSLSAAHLDFTFKHCLSQIQLYPYVVDADAQAVWGQVTAMAVAIQRNTCTFAVAANENTGEVIFSGTANQTFAVSGATAALPAVGADNAVQFGQPVMIEPQTSPTYTLVINLTTEKGGKITVTVPARAYKAGEATKIRIKLNANGPLATAEITAWQTPVVVDMAQNNDLPRLFYGDAKNNGSITTSLLGSSTTSYNSYVYTGTKGTNGPGYDNVATAYANEKPYYKLYVAPTDEKIMTGIEAQKACAAKTLDGGGWRLPRYSELVLIYNNRVALQSAGCATFINASYYSSTETNDRTKLWALNLTTGSATNFVAATANQYVRCVREIAEPSSYPYVSERKYIVSKDGNGSIAGVPFHGEWLTTPTHNDLSHDNSVAPIFEVAAEDCNDVNTPGVLMDNGMYYWEDDDVKTICSKYKQAGSPAGGWRLPTAKEALQIWACRDKGLLTNFSARTYWTATESTVPGEVWKFVMQQGGVPEAGEAMTASTVRCVRDVAEIPKPYVLINGIYWAEGNLVADGPHGCKIGAPTDGGLYFQFGSLIGWKGGALVNGGTGVGQNPYTNSGTQWWGGVSSWSWNNDAMVWPTNMVDKPMSWPQSTSDMNHQWFFSGQGITSGSINVTVPTKGVGDPCTYYLGAPWRLPTVAEYRTLFNDAENKMGWTSVSSWIWTMAPYNGAQHTDNTLYFPASGYRNYLNGSFSYVTANGYGWSSSVYSALYGYTLYFNSSTVSPQNYTDRSYGFPVRCVRDL